MALKYFECIVLQSKMWLFFWYLKHTGCLKCPCLQTLTFIFDKTSNFFGGAPPMNLGLVRFNSRLPHRLVQKPPVRCRLSQVARWRRLVYPQVTSWFVDHSSHRYVYHKPKWTCENGVICINLAETQLETNAIQDLAGQFPMLHRVYSFGKYQKISKNHIKPPLHIELFV